MRSGLCKNDHSLPPDMAAREYTKRSAISPTLEFNIVYQFKTVIPGKGEKENMFA